MAKIPDTPPDIPQNRPQPGVQRQPTLEEQIKGIKNQLTIIDADAHDLRMPIYDSLVQQILQSAQIIQQKDGEIKRLKEILKKHNISQVEASPTTEQKPPNRKERRALDKATKKITNKLIKDKEKVKKKDEKAKS